MDLITAVLIDDEQLALDTLQWQLKEFCPSVVVAASFTNPRLAYQYLCEHKVDVCFLDIDMPEMTGFEFLQQWETFHFDVIFATAYSEFAIQAFKVSAFDYLLKPIDEEDLIQTLEKYQHKKQKPKVSEQLSLLLNQLHQPTQQYSTRIALATTEGIHLVDVNQIIRLEADKNYTTVHLLDRAPVIISKTLKEVECVLDPNRFFRVHQSHTIDLQKVDMYHKGRGGNVTLSNKDTIPVSKNKKASLLEKLAS